MQDFEKLGVFYLGREYDIETKTLKDSLLLYDSKDLVTHAICVGMTGSGKTGLCISILEEAAIDGIPAIIVDPKGDLSNLLLTFPKLSPDDFLAWVNEDDARKKGVSVEKYAKQQSELWRIGLAEWGQDSTRIQQLHDATDFIIYTPGSNSGIPVSILKSFSAPDKSILDDADLLRERINTTVTSLLNLLGIEADPLQSREHILLSTILYVVWRKGSDLTLAELISTIQSPPVSKIGVFDLETFFPANDRLAFAMKLNNLIAAPGFESWLDGQPLDIGSIMYSPEGKPRIAIFSISHLNDAERMFFVSLLLTQLLGWIRTQSGTSSLRSIFYMDEIFGYFPPVANPPSKAPLMILLKQARAFGLGIVLATQNPVDLDYKGLSNTGTWFIGRLQTDRDKQKVLDGLEGTVNSTSRFDRQKMGQILAGLGSRVFLMNNVNEDEPVIFHTRWTLSYLRGPLARNQIKKLMDPLRSPKITAAPQTSSVNPTISLSIEQNVSYEKTKPNTPPGITNYFLAVRKQNEGKPTLVYKPVLLGMAKVYFVNATAGIATENQLSLITEYFDKPPASIWDNAREINISEKDLEKIPEEDGFFSNLPQQAAQKGNYADWDKSLKNWIARNYQLNLFKSSSFTSVSLPGESEKDFRVRLQLSAREKRDQIIALIREKYAPKIARLEEKIRRAEQTVEREKDQAKEQKIQTVISIGATILSAITGRKSMSRSTLGRATTAVRGAGRAMRETQDVDRAQENVEILKQQIEELQDLLSEEISKVHSSIDPLTETFETITMSPRKADISIMLVGLIWLPHWHDEKSGTTPAW